MLRGSPPRARAPGGGRKPINDALLGGGPLSNGRALCCVAGLLTGSGRHGGWRRRRRGSSSSSKNGGAGGCPGRLSSALGSFILSVQREDGEPCLTRLSLRSPHEPQAGSARWGWGRVWGLTSFLESRHSFAWSRDSPAEKEQSLAPSSGLLPLALAAPAERSSHRSRFAAANVFPPFSSPGRSRTCFASPRVGCSPLNDSYFVGASVSTDGSPLLTCGKQGVSFVGVFDVTDFPPPFLPRLTSLPPKRRIYFAPRLFCPYFLLTEALWISL